MMNTRYEKEIKILQDANDWALCRKSLTILAVNLKQDNVVGIVLNQARQFLLQYLEDSPNDVAITEAISAMENVRSITDLTKSGQVVWNILKSKARSPGINTYRNAMKEIRQLTSFDPASEQDIELFVDTLSAIIMASLDYKWGSQNYELWLKSFEHKNREDFFIRANHFTTNVQVIALNSNLWGQIATSIRDIIDGEIS